MRRLLDRYRTTPAAGAAVFVLLAAVLVLLFGPRHDHTPALVVIALALSVCVSIALGRFGERVSEEFDRDEGAR